MSSSDNSVNRTARRWPSWAHAPMLAILLVCAASPASAGRMVGLEEFASTADLICKATVIADRQVTDDSFESVDGYEVREAELRVVSIVKGVAPNVIRFRRYALTESRAARLKRWGFHEPTSPWGLYTMETGRTYLVVAAQTAAGTYRQLGKPSIVCCGPPISHGVLLAADAKPHHGTTLSEAAGAEALGLLKSPTEDEVVGAIRQLDWISRGQAWNGNLDRSQTLAAFQPLIGSKNEAIATAAITVFGQDSPYFRDQDAPFWFAGFGQGHIPGIGERTRPANPLPDVGAKELLQVATNGPTPEVRAFAIRALARNSRAVPASMVPVWSRDPSIAVRSAAVLVSVELPDRKPIVTASTDISPDVRRAAALAVGFAQDTALLRLLDNLLHDPAADVRGAAALSLVSFPLDEAAPVLKANLTSEFGPLFVNALAQRDPEPYLAMLAEVIEQQSQPANWWGGSLPAADSWDILFDFVKSRPAAELTAGKLDHSLDALERMHWNGSGEPSKLYALYVSCGLVSRAKQFREKRFPFDMKAVFDGMDQNHPAAHVR